MVNDAEAWALTAPVETELQRTLLLAMAADAVDRAAYFDADRFAKVKRYDRDHVLDELENLERAGVVKYTQHYQPFDVWILNLEA